MFNFFVDKSNRQADKYYISGNDFNHIKNVLRMNKGDSFLVSCDGKSDLCCLDSYEDDVAVAVIQEENYNSTELGVRLYLFQALPKSDKMELIIQKAVELGVYEIVPTEMTRCVVKLNDKKKSSKTQRWQAISESASKQSKRNIIPTVQEPVSYKQALNIAKDLDMLIVPYENERGMIATKEALSKIKDGMSVGILIGPEGGFEEKEVEAAVNIGGLPISLGSRILRTETAAIAALSICMLHIEMNVESDTK